MAGTRAPAAARAAALQAVGTDYGPTIPDPDEARARLRTLTRSQGEVLAQLARGWTVSEIAARRFVSVPTIRTQLKDINRTLGVHSVVEAVVTVYRAGGTQHCGPRVACIEAASVSYYDRQGQPIDFDGWCELLRHPSRHGSTLDVMATDVGDVTVCTIYVGVSDDDPPLIFETFVDATASNGGADLYIHARYATEAEALAGHNAAVAQVTAGQVR